MPKRQETSKSGVQAAKKQAKKKGIADGKQKGKARKELTGRDHQGNHDSKTKQPKKNDRHQHGIEQAGTAGSKK